MCLAQRAVSGTQKAADEEVDEGHQGERNESAPSLLFL